MKLYNTFKDMGYRDYINGILCKGLDEKFISDISINPSDCYVCEKKEHMEEACGHKPFLYFYTEGFKLAKKYYKFNLRCIMYKDGHKYVEDFIPLYKENYKKVLGEILSTPPENIVKSYPGGQDYLEAEERFNNISESWVEQT